MKQFLIFYDYDKCYIVQAENREEAAIEFCEYQGGGFLNKAELIALSKTAPFDRLVKIINNGISNEIQSLYEVSGSLIQHVGDKKKDVFTI